MLCFFDETIRNGSLFAIFTTIFGLQSSAGSGFEYLYRGKNVPKWVFEVKGSLINCVVKIFETVFQFKSFVFGLFSSTLLWAFMVIHLGMV